LVVTVAPPGEFLETFTFFVTVLPDTVTAPAPLVTLRSSPIVVSVILTAPDVPLTVTLSPTVPPLMATVEAPVEWTFSPIAAPVSVRLAPLASVTLATTVTPAPMVQD
jgi:hypothetical protein